MNYCPASTDEEFKAARAEAVRLLLSSESQWKVLIAGPGTGKTYSFGALIDRVEGKTLVISFLGNLVQDLAQSLGNRARVCTFHSFCRNQLHKLDIAGITHDVDYYPPFLSIVDADLGVVLPAYASDSLEKAYVLLDDSEGLVSRGLSIGNYYDAVGHVDSVYRVFKTYKAAAARPRLRSGPR